MKIYELTFTGTEKLFTKTKINYLPKDAKLVPFNFNKPVYYSESTGQYYYKEQGKGDAGESPAGCITAAFRSTYYKFKEGLK